MNKQQRMQNRANAHRLKVQFRPKPLCPECGKPGPHFVMPCWGEEGFFMCDPSLKWESVAEDGKAK